MIPLSAARADGTAAQALVVAAVTESFGQLNRFYTTQLTEELLESFLESHRGVTAASALLPTLPAPVDQMNTLVRILRQGTDGGRIAVLRGITMSPSLTYRLFFELSRFNPTTVTLDVRAEVMRIEHVIVDEFSGFVRSRLSARQRSSGYADDLVSEGKLALIRAARGYDPSHPTNFAGYAGTVIDRAILAEEYRHSRPTRLPAEQEAIRRQAERVTRRLRIELNQDPSLEQIAAEMGIAPTQLSDLRSAAQNSVSIDESDSNIESVSGDTEMEVLRSQTRALLLSRIDTLPEREREIVTAYFGLRSNESARHFDFAGFGARYSIGSQRARQLLWSGLERLRFLSRDLRPDADALEPAEPGTWSRPMFRNILRRLAAIGVNLSSEAFRFEEDPVTLDVIEDFFGGPASTQSFRRHAIREYGRWSAALADIGIALGRVSWEGNVLGRIIRDLIQLKLADPNSVELSRAGLLEDRSGNVRKILDRYFPGNNVSILAFVLRLWEARGGVDLAFGRHAESRQVRWGTSRAVMRAFRLIADLKLTSMQMRQNVSEEAQRRLTAMFGPDATTAKLYSAIRRHWRSLAAIIQATKDLSLRDFRAGGRAERNIWGVERIQIFLRALVEQHTQTNPDLSRARLSEIGTVTAIVDGKPVTATTTQLYEAVGRSEAFTSWLDALASIVGIERARQMAPLPPIRWNIGLIARIFSDFEARGFATDIQRFTNIPRETRAAVIEAHLERPMAPQQFEVNAFRVTQSQNWSELALRIRSFRARQAGTIACVNQGIRASGVPALSSP